MPGSRNSLAGALVITGCFARARFTAHVSAVSILNRMSSKLFEDDACARDLCPPLESFRKVSTAAFNEEVTECMIPLFGGFQTRETCLCQHETRSDTLPPSDEIGRFVVLFFSTLPRVVTLWPVFEVLSHVEGRIMVWLRALRSSGNQNGGPVGSWADKLS